MKANRKQTGSKPEANEEQGESKPEANRKREQSESEGEKENEIENECSPSLYLPHAENGSKPEAQIGTVVYPPVKGPTLDQVREYARIRRSQADPKAFFDYYAAAGWRDREGKPVLNWQQTFIAWELREQRGGKNGRSVGKQGLSCMDKDRDLTREEEAYRDKVLEMRRHMEEQRARKKAAAGGGEG